MAVNACSGGTVRVRGARRIEREAVARAHPLEGPGLAVVQLREAALDTDGDMVLRYDADPVIALAHGRLLVRREIHPRHNATKARRREV